MALIEDIESLLPGWMRRSSLAHWRDLAGSIAVVVDALIEGAFDGRLASFPGQVELAGLGGFESVDAHPLIGRDRRIVKGPTESDAAYARRLRQWRAAWRSAGTAYGMLTQLSGVLNPNPPRVRLVTASGLWYTLEADGTFILNTPNGRGFTITPTGVSSPNTGLAHPFDWDSSAGNPADPFRIWPIIYAPTNKPLDKDEGDWGDFTTFYGEKDKTIGTAATGTYVEFIRDVCRTWKPAGVRVPYIIIAFDPNSFDPLTPGPYPAAGMPDGHWHHHGKVIQVGPNLQRVSARLQTARYWRGEK